MKTRLKAFSLIELSVVILIVGILVAGATQSSNLVRKYRIRSAQSLTKSSDVSSIKDIVFWGEPTLSESFTSTTNGDDPQDGDKISAWNDINLQNRVRINLTQSTDDSRPTYKQYGINNLPSLNFDGTNDNLASTTVPVPEEDDTYMMFVVWRTPYNNVSGMVMSMGGSADGTMSGLLSRGGGTYGFVGLFNDAGSLTTATNKANITAIKVDNNSSNNISIYAESLTPAFSGPSNSAATLNISSGSFSVGSRAGTVQFFSGLVSEIIIFDRILMKEELKSVMTYLGKKYNVRITP